VPSEKFQIGIPNATQSVATQWHLRIRTSAFRPSLLRRKPQPTRKPHRRQARADRARTRRIHPRRALVAEPQPMTSMTTSTSATTRRPNPHTDRAHGHCDLVISALNPNTRSGMSSIRATGPAAGKASPPHHGLRSWQNRAHLLRQARSHRHNPDRQPRPLPLFAAQNRRST